jgi:4-amino-4-deoxy-L-arabinose transferase-like glycosyltransferase
LTSRSAVDSAYSWALALVAALPRLFVAIAWAREPVWDGHYYHLGATRIAAGLGYSEDVIIRGAAVWKPWTHYPVGYSAMLGALYRVFGEHLLVAPLFSAALGAASAVLVHRIALPYLGPTRARVAGALVALHPGLIAYSALVMTELPSAFLLLLLFWILLRFRGQWRAVVFGGLVLGVLTLTRPASLLLFPLLLLSDPRPLSRALLRSLALLAVTLAVVLPWTVRNCVRMDGCALVSTNGGWNLAIGAITETGRFQTLRGTDGCPNVRGQVQQDDCWAQVGVRKIKESPGRWLGAAPKKLAQTFNHESFAVEYLHEADPGAWPERRRAAARGLLTAAHLALLAVAALSIVALPLRRARGQEQYWQLAVFSLLCVLMFYGVAKEERPFHWLVLATPLLAFVPFPGRPHLGAVGRMAMAVVLVTALTHVVFFGEDRYHLFLSPLFCLLAAAALREGERVAVRPSQGYGFGLGGDSER